MRDVKPAQMTSWLCHLLFLDRQGLRAGALALWPLALWGMEEHGWRMLGRWEGASCSLREGEWRGVEHSGQLTRLKSILVRQWGQG